MTVNPSTMRLGIAAILIGLVGAYGVRVMMDEEEAPPEEVVVTQFLVPLASQDLPVGRVIHQGDISLRKMDADMMKQESMPMELVMMSADQIMGRRLRKPLRLGEPFLTNALFLDKDEPGYDLKPGYRAVAVTVSLSRGGSAEAGDVVDVFFTSTPKAADAKTGQIAIPEKTILVTDAVTVLEVKRPEPQASGYKANDPSFLLQVLPDQVALYQTLQGHGEFSFMIRASDDVAIAKNVDEDGLTIEEALGIKPEEPPPPQPVWPVEKWYRGQRTVDYFPIPQRSPEQIAEYQRQLAEEQAKLAAQGDEAVADASPKDEAPAPAPIKRRPTLREPQPTASPTPAERSPRVPLREPPAAALTRPTSPEAAGNSGSADTADPFGDDEVLP